MLTVFPGLKRPPSFANYSLIEKYIREMNLVIDRVVGLMFFTCSLCIGWDQMGFWYVFAAPL